MTSPWNYIYSIHLLTSDLVNLIISNSDKHELRSTDMHMD